MVSFLAEGDGLEYAIAVAVPEPSTLAMLGTGLPIILVYAWCRRRRTPVDI
jgi:tRNA U54 and U55 pseudouridine synthase Pus10